MNRIRSSKEKRKEAATAPRLVLWLGSINSSSNLSRKSHSSSNAAANRFRNEGREGYLVDKD